MSGLKKKWNLKRLIAKGDHRINQIQLMVRQKYQGIPNLSVIPHFGMGTGTDIIVIAHGNKILELREVTNFDRSSYINTKRKNMIIKSLTKKVYWVSWGKSKKRFYPIPETKRFLDVSYEDNILKGHWKDFKAHGIEVKIWNRTDYVMGYTVEDKHGNKKSYYWNGKEV